MMNRGSNELEYLASHSDGIELPKEDKIVIAVICWKYKQTSLETGKVIDESKRIILAEGEINSENPNEYLFLYREPGYEFTEELNLNISGYEKLDDYDEADGTKAEWEINVVDYVTVDWKRAYEITTCTGELLGNEGDQ